MGQADEDEPGVPTRGAPARSVRGRVMRWLGVLAVSLAGAVVGWGLAPGTSTFVGPLEVAVELRPSLTPGVRVQLPPVGEVRFATHTGPIVVQASVLSVDLEQAQALVASPQGLLALQLAAPEVLQEAVVRAAAWAFGCSVAGAGLLGLAVYRLSWRPVQTTALALVVVVALGGTGAATFESAALRAPRFTGLLSSAPYVAGEGRDVAARLESYRSGLADFVQSVTTLYAVADRLPVLPRGGETTTVLHISDMHLNPLGFDLAERLVEQFGVDVVVDTGDITTWGTAVESATLSRIGRLEVPYVFVRGNHDSPATQAAVAAQPNAVVLDGAASEVAGIVFAGIGDPRFTPDGEDAQDDEANREQVGQAARELRGVVREQPRTRSDGRGVDVALIHDPGRLDSLFGQVPLILAGHYHRSIVRVDEASGTQVMVQGSTGGAGITARGLARLGEGEPLSLTATLLYFGASGDRGGDLVAPSGDRGGDLVAFDQVTVGGLGLTSVTIERTLVPDNVPAEPDGDQEPFTQPTVESP